MRELEEIIKLYNEVSEIHRCFFIIPKDDNTFYITTNKIASTTISNQIWGGDYGKNTFYLEYSDTDGFFIRYHKSIIPENDKYIVLNIISKINRAFKLHDDNLNVYVLYRNPLEYYISAIAEDYVKLPKFDLTILNETEIVRLRNFIRIYCNPKTNLENISDFKESLNTMFDDESNKDITQKIILNGLGNFFNGVTSPHNEGARYPFTGHFEPTYLQSVMIFKMYFKQKFHYIDIDEINLKEIGIIGNENKNSKIFKQMVEDTFFDLLKNQPINKKQILLNVLANQINYYYKIKNE